ncbi:MAG TPA: hypothetical protein VM409_04385 [Chloroflexia bacterium]|nr:hypothetical protein [Chloroflexia bacterium]
MPHARAARPEARRSGWRHLGWRLLLAAFILLLMSLDVPIPGTVIYILLPVTLLVWGGLLVTIADGNLYCGPGNLRVAWSVLAAGAYLAVSVPGLVRGMPSFLDALGMVVPLTLVPHLARRDLTIAMRDWATLTGVSLYAALGVQAMWVLVSSLGLPVFFIVALLPPFLFEAAILVLDRRAMKRQNTVIALALATTVATSLLAATQFNRNMVPAWLGVFGFAVGLLLAASLVLTTLSRPLIEAAAGSDRRRNPVARSLVELSHGPILISLVLYLPLSLLR